VPLGEIGKAARKRGGRERKQGLQNGEKKRKKAKILPVRRKKLGRVCSNVKRKDGVDLLNNGEGREERPSRHHM